MDWVIGRYAVTVLPNLEGEELDRLERFLSLPDPDLQQWFHSPHLAAGTEFAAGSGDAPFSWSGVTAARTQAQRTAQALSCSKSSGPCARIQSTADAGASQTVDPGDKLRDDALKDHDGDRPAKKNMDALIQHDLIFSGVPEGLDALVLSRLTREAAAASGGPGYVLHVARDDRRLESLRAALAFFDPKVRVIVFPAWDTVPYDRVGPNAEIVAKRMTALARLVVGGRREPTLVLTTVNAILQRVPPRQFVRNAIRQMAPGQRIDMNLLVQRLLLGGYQRTGTVMEPGEFAVRGGILDLFPPGRANPVRLDFFGDTLESIKTFDPETQRTHKLVQKLTLLPVSEVAFGEAAEKTFRSRYVELFGGGTSDDPLYQAVSVGQRYPGMEQGLPLFHEKLETLFDYVQGSDVSFDHLAEDAVAQRLIRSWSTIRRVNRWRRRSSVHRLRPCRPT